MNISISSIYNVAFFVFLFFFNIFLKIVLMGGKEEKNRFGETRRFRNRSLRKMKKLKKKNQIAIKSKVIKGRQKLIFKK